MTPPTADLCFCGGTFYPATVTLRVRDTLLARDRFRPVDGYRCDRCGFEAIDAKVSREIQP